MCFLLFFCLDKGFKEQSVGRKFIKRQVKPEDVYNLGRNKRHRLCFSKPFIGQSLYTLSKLRCSLDFIAQVGAAWKGNSLPEGTQEP